MDVREPLQHIVFIIDGNRRWAKKRGKPSFFGHRAGGKNVEKITTQCLNRGIPYITFWVLSTENVKERSKQELSFLYKMIGELPKNITKLDKQGVRINIVGDLSGIPAAAQKSLQMVVAKTAKNKKATVTLAVNYGGRDELLRAIRKIKDAPIPAQEISEQTISQFLDTKGLPDPDMIVRTGGKVRLSGIFPWQCVYSEFYFTEVLWPDFDEQELLKAFQYFQSVQRNFGK
jgi:undecaprenyl diphosphate synthase